ncbi:hypothetical protein GCM10009827_012170 [Dactylosporangium maewongense]|uniref:DUF1214 domain-containing protein n=1 Tax=Dactylosporangium maewongense TaxID=634393 RepID=A0ABN1ZPC5_9ACTN
MPLPVTIWNLRADKYSAAGVDQTDLAEEFRTSVRMTTLQNYLVCPKAGATEILKLSITVYIGRTQSANAPAENWLPVSDAPFNIMLRVYGPEDNTDPDNNPPYNPPYNPPPINLSD